MTDSDLTKYDWRRRLGDGGSGVYPQSPIKRPQNPLRWDFKKSPFFSRKKPGFLKKKAQWVGLF